VDGNRSLDRRGVCRGRLRLHRPCWRWSCTAKCGSKRAVGW